MFPTLTHRDRALGHDSNRHRTLWRTRPPQWLQPLQQPRLPTTSSQSRVQSVTATVDYHVLATATRLNDGSASNLDKGTQPK